MFAIKRIKDGLYYNHLNWVPLGKARLFKRKQDLVIFLAFNVQTYYNNQKSRGKGLASFENGLTSKDMVITKKKDFKIVELELKEK